MGSGGELRDKSWIQINNRLDPSYIRGVGEFINFAKHHVDSAGRIRCPCKHCNNCIYKMTSLVYQDLIRYGMIEEYTRWIHHGEPYELNNSSDGVELHNDDVLGNTINNRYEDVSNLLEDLQRGTCMETNRGEGSTNQGPNKEFNKFSNLWNEAQTQLYPGCQNYTKLSFLVRLMHNKIMTNSSIKAFNMNLELFKDALPMGETLPKSYYEVRKLMRDLGLGYVNIDACPNDCTLFWKENERYDHCLNSNCKVARWKSGLGKHSKIPQKVARYFPIKPRLQRLFMSKEIAQDMRWHKEKHVDDSVMRHPADAKEWQEFDKRHSWFANDARNVRLGLASDGFNPFGNMSVAYSMWPVVLVIYNLPPWKCMKEPFFILAMLIPGKDSPGNDIDVYLTPLIDDLKELWVDGIDTYDAYSGENFKLHAALLWTINDFPAYGMLSGWSTKGKLACPVCNKGTCSITLKNGGKQCYMSHRRYLDANHVWRRSKKFDGRPEHRPKPKELSGDDILAQLSLLSKDFTYGKPPNKRKRKRTDDELNWTKKSIFFELPYWSTMMLRHNLDVMHIEKNICENVLATLMNIEGKTKDNVKARLDLELLGIRKELHIQKDGDKFLMPIACYTLALAERRALCEWLKCMKLPDGYASNISRCVNVGEGKISGLKIHDYHVFLQRLLPLVAHGFLRKDIYYVLSELSCFFKDLCSKTLDKIVLEKLHKDIALILCKLEMIYPPSFFVIMVHLAVHLPREVQLGGPV